MIQRIAVIGAGTMGCGIASAFAMHGYQVSLYESFSAVRNGVTERMRGELSFLAEEQYIEHNAIKATLANITLTGDLTSAVTSADFVLEAIPEDLALKKALFAQLDVLCPARTIFASNTSSLPLEEMMVDLPPQRKARTMVCHWYNPAYLIPIAELSFFGNMELKVFDEVYALHVRAGKQPIKVLKDIPGLIANRILHAMAREVFHLIEIGVASAEDIDKALKFGPGFRAATAGILETADMGGLDVWCAVEDNLFPALSKTSEACALMRSKVEEGKMGVKTGEGFYSYPDGKKDDATKAFRQRLLIQLKTSENYV